MTYSRPLYLPVELAVAASINDDYDYDYDFKNYHHPNKYQLYEYVDRAGNYDYVDQSGVVVLFVPGHWGSYKQARSLGAHGVGRTRLNEYYTAAHTNTHRHDGGHRQDAIHTNNIESSSSLPFWTGQDGIENPSNYTFYRVYTLDFDEEGTGFHGILVDRQTIFLAHSIKTILTKHPSMKYFVIVGHSFGGVVAQNLQRIISEKGLLNDDKLIQSLMTKSSLITLGTPHRGTPWSLEVSINQLINSINHNYYSKRKVGAKLLQTTLISGGLRDDLVRPEDSVSPHIQTIFAHSYAHTTNEYRRRYSSYESCSLGVDHKGLVWCQHILRLISELIDKSFKATRTNSFSEANCRSSTCGTFKQILEADNRELREMLGSLDYVGFTMMLPYSLEHLLASIIVLLFLNILALENNISFVVKSMIYLMLQGVVALFNGFPILIALANCVASVTIHMAFSRGLDSLRGAFLMRYVPSFALNILSGLPLSYMSPLILLSALVFQLKIREDDIYSLLLSIFLLHILVYTIAIIWRYIRTTHQENNDKDSNSAAAMKFNYQRHAQNYALLCLMLPLLSSGKIYLAWKLYHEGDLCSAPYKNYVMFDLLACVVLSVISLVSADRCCCSLRRRFLLEVHQYSKRRLLLTFHLFTYCLLSAISLSIGGGQYLIYILPTFLLVNQLVLI